MQNKDQGCRIQNEDIMKYKEGGMGHKIYNGDEIED